MGRAKKGGKVLGRSVALIPGFLGSPIQDGGREFSACSLIRLLCRLPCDSSDEWHFSQSTPFVLNRDRGELVEPFHCHGTNGEISMHSWTHLGQSDDQEFLTFPRKSDGLSVGILKRELFCHPGRLPLIVSNAPRSSKAVLGRSQYSRRN